MTRRTILHVIESDGPGGAETVFADLVLRADSARFATIAVVPGITTWLTARLGEHERRLVAPTGWPTSKPFDFAYVRSLRRVVREVRADIVHAHSFGSAVYAAAALAGSRTQLVITLHGRVDVTEPGRLAACKWWLLRRAVAVVCVSKSLRLLAEATRGARSLRLSTIYNGIDVERFAVGRNTTLRAQLNLPDGELLIGAVGNVRTPKAYDVLLRAVASVRDQGVNIHLAIAGDDAPSPLVEMLLSLRDALHLREHVTFVGYVDEVAAFLNGLDVFVLSSHTEGFSLATVQALAAGLPVIATRCGGPEEIIESNISGLLVQPGSPDALASAIVTLSRDKGARERLSRAARSRSLEAFSIAAMVHRYEALYDSVCCATQHSR